MPTCDWTSATSGAGSPQETPADTTYCDWEPIGARFDELTRFPTWLRIIAAVATSTGLEFSVLEEAVGVSTSRSSKLLRVIAAVEYLVLDKRPTDSGSRAPGSGLPPPDDGSTSDTWKR